MTTRSSTPASPPEISNNSRQPVRLPTRYEWLFNGFRRYVLRFVRKNFHAVRLSKAGAPIPTGDAPILIVLNHPGWWDPMICTVLSQCFPGREQFAAINAVAVKKYPFFTKMGFFGVDTQTLRGAAEFLRTATMILSAPRRVAWVTAQGRFSDVRVRPLELRSGVGHLAARLESGLVLPIALEYAFWNERTPEALVRVGPAIDVTEAPGRSAKDWTARIEAALTETLDALNAETMTRDPERFATLLDGKTGIGGPYDALRRVVAWARGRRFEAAHETPAAGAKS
ncbi:lysophospholipid acyltransferase family protein [Fimbriiglobus ruber]|uniref:Phospholipid/glycerol acyltransferase domain-containing protein n=1 Tax=Fimbriiglobus ruber TaxID=1908690 RepID=A0A225DBD7_9BACT|nr:lysophospholipid acyltransferase family protein [Fimbriiglobus ruber]OWK38303.1 hypothetical protein FRUB_07423 [Fimbriiglobus ruber]